MLFKAIPASVVALLKEIHLLPLPSDTYLAGGTAVALYLGHRISVDIDLFTEKEFYSGPIVSSFKERYKVEVVSTAEKDTFIRVHASYYLLNCPKMGIHVIYV